MKSTPPFFSIIVPTFNRGSLVIEAIESILSQTNVTLEIILIDDGSTDQTQQLINEIKDDRIRYFKTKNVERGAARNIGLTHATGLFVNYFDSDDLYYPCLQTVRDFITNNKFPDVVYGDIHSMTSAGAISEDSALPFSSFKENILFNNFLACGSVFVKQEIARMNLFSDDRRLSGSEDWELWLRLYASCDFTRVPVAIFKQRQHANRSLLTSDASQVTVRENLFATLIDNNRTILRKRFSDGEINLLMADRMTLIALMQFVAGNSTLSFQYWSRSFRLSIRVLKRKRFLAVAKKLMFR